MPWFSTEQDEERKRKTQEALEKSRSTSKRAQESKDRVLRSLQEIEEIVKDDRLRRGSDSERS